MKNMIHSHYYQGTTDMAWGHTHTYSGETSKDPDYPGHIHYVSGFTRVDDQHTHYYAVLIGPEVGTGAGHVHFYLGYTTVNYRHIHYFCGYTDGADSNRKSKTRFASEEAQGIGNQLGIDWSKFDVEQYRTGLDVELEHGRIKADTNVTNDDPIITGKITLAHLNEFPDYYTRLTKMEEEAEEYFKKRS